MRVLVICLIWAAGTVASVHAAEPEPKSRLANAIAVIVDDAVITFVDVEQFIAPAVDVLLRQYGNNPKVLEEKLMAVRRDGTEQLVERQLIIADWNKSGFQLPDSVVEDEINDRVRARYGGDRLTLTKTLQAQDTTWEAFRKQVREDIIVQALRARNMGGGGIHLAGEDRGLLRGAPGPVQDGAAGKAAHDRGERAAGKSGRREEVARGNTFSHRRGRVVCRDGGHLFGGFRSGPRAGAGVGWSAVCCGTILPTVLSSSRPAS